MKHSPVYEVAEQFNHDYLRLAEEIGVSPADMSAWVIVEGAAARWSLTHPSLVDGR